MAQQSEIKEKIDFKEIMKQKLTPTERFLLNSKLLNFGKWIAYQKNDTGAYLHSSGVFAFSNRQWPKLKEGYKSIEVSFEILKQILEAYEQNESDTIEIHFKDSENPLLFYTNKVWGLIAPRINGDIEEEE